jgi:PhzF family phenazine biosynthesis protein
MKQYVVDAFTDRLFSGNPAAVCVLESELSDDLMLNIAKENNLSETAFITKEDGVYNLRWFTPTGEIDFCGHATLASAFTLFNFYDETEKIVFKTMKDTIVVNKIDEYYELIFPKYNYKQIEISDDIISAFSVEPLEAFLSRDLLLVFDNKDYYKIKPNFNLIGRLNATCVAITTDSSEYDCISRVFAPSIGVNEDPVTGSTHCLIAPYWSQKLNKKEIKAYQDSSRGGFLQCTVLEDKVRILGKAVLYSISELQI